MSRSRFRVGQGYDVHPLVAGRKLMLGGVEIPHDKGLSGHSDADVLLHALGDAILGAAGLGDMGAYFSPEDERWRDAASSELLRRIVARVHDHGWMVMSCDMTLIAEAPRLAPFRDSIRRHVAEILEVEVNAVGLKATTHEGLGALGRGEGMAALAVALLSDRDEGTG